MPPLSLTGDVKMHPQPGGPERVAFRLKATRRIHDKFAPVRVVPAFNELGCLAVFTETEGIISDKLVP